MKNCVKKIAMDTKGEITDWKVEWNVDDVTDKEQI